MDQNQEMEKEWQTLKEWYLKESDKIDEKYPYRGGLDPGIECIMERRALKNEFQSKIDALRKKYGLK